MSLYVTVFPLIEHWMESEKDPLPKGTLFSLEGYLMVHGTFVLSVVKKQNRHTGEITLGETIQVSKEEFSTCFAEAKF